MSLPDLIARFVQPLAQLEVPYMVIGGVAGIIYSEPRYTQDLDLLARLDPAQAGALAAAFPAEEFYVPPIEVIEQEASRSSHGHFNLSHHESGLRADVYLAGEDPLHAWGLSRRRSITLRGEALWLAPIEYVILGKLKFFREGGSVRHLEDIARMLLISADQIDHLELQARVADQGLGPEWEQAQRSARRP